MAVTGDIPAIGDMMGSARHMSYDGCRVCDTEGVRVGGAMCFPDDGPRYGRIKSAIDLTMGNPDRNIVAVPQLFSSIITFSGVPFFAMDEMHLIARGIAKLVYDLINPAINTKFREIGDRIKESRGTIPRIFEGGWTDHFGAYRAVDWQDFLGVAMPLIVCPNFVRSTTDKAVMDLVNGCNRALSHELDTNDILKLESLFKQWHAFCKTEVERGRLNNRVFTLQTFGKSHQGSYKHDSFAKQTRDQRVKQSA
ncbi:hypothetical protein G6F56_012457 [Rhizopus delemar]|nr:hypothetical protein G6F56_012457 [Rhizopus delemar]